MSETGNKWSVSSFRLWVVSMYGEERANQVFFEIQGVVVKSLQACQDMIVQDRCGQSTPAARGARDRHTMGRGRAQHEGRNLGLSAVFMHWPLRRSQTLLRVVRIRHHGGPRLEALASGGQRAAEPQHRHHAGPRVEDDGGVG